MIHFHDDNFNHHLHTGLVEIFNHGDDVVHKFRRGQYEKGFASCDRNESHPPDQVAGRHLIFILPLRSPPRTNGAGGFLHLGLSSCCSAGFGTVGAKPLDAALNGRSRT